MKKIIPAETVSNLIKDFKKIGVLQNEIAEHFGFTRHWLSIWKRKGVKESRYNELVALYEKKLNEPKKTDGFKVCNPPGRIHLRTKKLFSAGGVKLKPKPGETYTCCTMIIVDDEFQSTDDKEKATCKDCLKRLYNLH